jgi:hypothetical protein
MRIRTQVTALVRNEQRKLSATWCNTLATAVITAGTFAPLAAIFYGLAPASVDYDHLRAFAGVCLVSGIILHFLGRFLLKRLEST